MSTKPRPTFLQSLRDLRESLCQLWCAILRGKWNDAPRVASTDDCQFSCFEVDQGDGDESLTRLYRVVATNRTATSADVLWQLPQIGSMHKKRNAIAYTVQIAMRQPCVWDCVVIYRPIDGSNSEH